MACSIFISLMYDIKHLPGDFKIPDEESRTPPHSKKLNNIQIPFLCNFMRPKTWDNDFSKKIPKSDISTVQKVSIVYISSRYAT